MDYNLAIRRRLGWYNHVRHKGRYVADSITRRFKMHKEIAVIYMVI